MPRVLLIEDEIGAIAALKRALVRGGFEVAIATNVADALSSAENGRPDAVLVSRGLQGGNTGDLPAALRALDPTRPLVILGEGEGIEGPSLPRPVDGGRLVEMLRSVLGESAPEELESSTSPAPPLVPPPEAPPTPSFPEALVPETFTALPDDPEPEPELPPEHLPTPTPPSPAHAPTAPSTTPPSPTPEERRRQLMARVEALRAATRSAPLRGTPAARTTTPVAPKPPAPPPNPPAAASPTPPPAPPPEPAPAPPPARPSAPPAAPIEPPESIAIPTAAPPTPPPAPRPPFPPRDLELPLTGSLERVEPAALVVACHRSRLTGRLVFVHGPTERSLFWEEGRILGATSDAPEERLEALAYRRGLLTREQQRQLRADPTPGTRRLAMLMLERSFIKPTELFPLVQDRVEEILFASLASAEGSYRILPEAVPDEDRTASARPVLSLVTEAIRRKYTEERLAKLTGGRTTLLRLRDDPPAELTEFGLTAREALLAQAIDGLRTLEDLWVEGGSEPLAGLQILYALVVGGRVEIAVRGLDVARPPEVDAAIDRARITEKYQQIRNANYFEILGLTAQATTTEIQRAYERLSQEFQPWRHPVAPEVQERLEEIQRVLGEARDVLADEALREGYTRHLGPSAGRG